MVSPSSPNPSTDTSQARVNAEAEPATPLEKITVTTPLYYGIEIDPYAHNAYPIAQIVEPIESTIGGASLLTTPPSWGALISTEQNVFGIWNSDEVLFQTLDFEDSGLYIDSCDGHTSMLACGKPVAKRQAGDIRVIEWFLRNDENGEALHLSFELVNLEMVPRIGLIAPERLRDALTAGDKQIRAHFMADDFDTNDFLEYLKTNYVGLT